MPVDYGQLSRRDRERLKRARRRAGVKPKPVRGENAAQKAGREEDGSYRLLSGKVRDAETGKVRKPIRPAPRPVRGENAREKARVQPIEQLRSSFEDLQHGRISTAQFGKRLAAAGLSDEEKQDFGRYTGARSRQVQRETFGKLKRDTGRFLDEAVGATVGVKPSEAFWSFTNPIERLTAPDQGAGVALPWGPAGKGSRLLRPRGVNTLAEASARPAGAQKIIEALPEARKLRRAQEAGYSVERGKRAARAEQAMQRGDEEGYQAALAALKGELPKLKFGALENFDQEAATELFRHIQQHPELRLFEKVRTRKGLERVFAGSVPTASETKLLERTFGPDVTAQITESIPFWRQAKTAGYDVINVPRAIKSSFDLSAPFRQGLVLGARHPRMFASEFKPMIRAMKSPEAYDEIMEEIASRPTFKAMEDAKLQLTDLMGLSTREEAFMSNFAENIPVVGIGVRGSGRAYVAFLNKFRADAFDNYLRLADEQGLDIADPQLLKSIANWVNTATGRGSVKSLEGAMVPLNAMFFSPRLIASRLQLLNPAYYAKLDPFARKQAVRGMAQLAGGISLTLWMAKMAGAEVGVDPRSADFGKIKAGDTRVDIAGGLQQYIVAASRIIKGESVSSTTGEVTRLEGGFAKPSRWSLAGDFLENKMSPVAAYVVDWAKNENFAGDPFDPAKETGRLFLPLGAENAYEGFKESPAAGAASVGLGGIGFGVQTYGLDPVQAKRAERRASLAKRGPVHVRDHEDRMTKLKAAAKDVGLPTSDPDVQAAVVSSRRIRDLDMQLSRARKKKGDNLTYQERARIVARMAVRVFPEYRAEIEAELATKDWERVYKLLRHEIRSPFEEAVA